MNSMPGAPTELDLAKTRLAAETQKGPTNKYVWYTRATTPQADTEYPLVPFQNDPHTDVFKVKNDLAAGRMQVQATDEDAKFVLRQRDQDEQAKFDAWVSQKYDLTDPAQQQMLQQIVPGLYQRREDLLNYLSGLQTQYAKIRLRGAKSEDDLRLQWLIDTGRIQMPQGPIWDPRSWRVNETGTRAAYIDWLADKDANAVAYLERDSQFMEDRYKEGFFNPIKWITNNLGHAPDPQNYFNVAGTNVALVVPGQEPVRAVDNYSYASSTTWNNH